jgi:surfactin family lipopeptide synthetase A
MSLSQVKRALLNRYMRGDVPSGGAGSQVIAPRPSGEPAPTSLSQEQLLLRERNTPHIPPLYNECVTVRMRGAFEVPVLARSLEEIIRRHEIWRTSYQQSNGHIIQIVHSPPEQIGLYAIDLRHLSPVRQQSEVQQVMGEVVCQPFDLERGPLVRFRLIRTEDFEYHLFLIAHLSIVDGVSAYQIFPFELATLYRAFSTGQNSPLPVLVAQFGDYAYWQRHWLQGEELFRRVEYWRTQLAGVVPLAWPTDRPRLGKQTFGGAIHAFALSKDSSKAVKALSQHEGVTLFVSLLSTFAALLHGYTQQEDIVVGTRSPAGRKRSEVEKLLGYFLNPVALRFDLTGNPTFRGLLQQAQRLTLEAISNDDVPVELLEQELKLAPDLSRHPLFTVAISLQPPMPPMDLNWNVTSMDIDNGGTPWDLYLAFIDNPSGVLGRVQYNPDLFAPVAIARLLEDFQQLLETASENPLKRLSALTCETSLGAVVAAQAPQSPTAK